MPSTAPPPASPPEYTRQPRVPGEGIWDRISEGCRWEKLGPQFGADPKASYGFYGKDLDWEQLKTIPAWRRPFRVAKHFFWALVMKMTPARRVLLFVALAMLILSSPKLYVGRSFT